jgi:hypothetical protein
MKLAIYWGKEKVNWVGWVLVAWCVVWVGVGLAGRLDKPNVSVQKPKKSVLPTVVYITDEDDDRFVEAAISQQFIDNGVSVVDDPSMATVCVKVQCKWTGKGNRHVRMISAIAKDQFREVRASVLAQPKPGLGCENCLNTTASIVVEQLLKQLK